LVVGRHKELPEPSVSDKVRKNRPRTVRKRPAMLAAVGDGERGGTSRSKSVVCVWAVVESRQAIGMPVGRGGLVVGWNDPGVHLTARGIVAATLDTPLKRSKPRMI